MFVVHVQQIYYIICYFAHNHLCVVNMDFTHFSFPIKILASYLVNKGIIIRKVDNTFAVLS